MLMPMDTDTCNVCGGVHIGGIEPLPAGQPRCTRCDMCVKALRECGGLVAGGGLREADAFLVFATVAPDSWLPAKCAGMSRQAIGAGTGGLGATAVGKALRRWMTALLRAGFGDVTQMDEGKQVKMTGVQDRPSWRNYFGGVQLWHDASKSNSDSEALTIGGGPSPHPPQISVVASHRGRLPSPYPLPHCKVGTRKCSW